MSVAHTPGPWAFSFENIDPEWAVVTATGGLVIANVNADYRQEANARLICAAPDLVAALAAMVDEPQPAGITRPAYQAALSAISKATGGAP